MGKKSRLKRGRRSKPSALGMDIKGGQARSGIDYEADFRRRDIQLRDLFSKYSPIDVALALGVSDLWLPNISSQVKHHFALGVFVSMHVGRFTRTEGLETYGAFCDFIKAVYALLPSFPSLEDFIPEPDWGEIQVPSNNRFLKVFYGSSVERIPDFIQAFKLRYETQPAALGDMHFALSVQDRFISRIDREVIGDARDIYSGHVETPSEQFWCQCRSALLSTVDMLPTNAEDINPALILELGTFNNLASLSSFGNAVMDGTSLPAVLVRIEGKLIPLSLRNAASVVIDLWAGKEVAQIDTFETSISRSVASFLLLRLPPVPI